MDIQKEAEIIAKETQEEIRNLISEKTLSKKTFLSIQAKMLQKIRKLPLEVGKKVLLTLWDMATPDRIAIEAEMEEKRQQKEYKN